MEEKWEGLFSNRQLGIESTSRQNDNAVRTVNFVTSRNLFAKSTMFPHRNIHQYTWTSPDGKTHNRIDHILIDRKWYLCLLDVRSAREAYCDTDHCLVVAKFRESLAACKQAARNFYIDRFNLRKINEVEIKK